MRPQHLPHFYQLIYVGEISSQLSTPPRPSLQTEQQLAATILSSRWLRQPDQINRKSIYPFTMSNRQTKSRVRSTLWYTPQLEAAQELNNSTHRNSRPHTDHRHHPDTQTHLLQSIFRIQASIHVQHVQHTPAPPPVTLLVVPGRPGLGQLLWAWVSCPCP